MSVLCIDTSTMGALRKCSVSDGHNQIFALIVERLEFISQLREVTSQNQQRISLM